MILVEGVVYDQQNMKANILKLFQRFLPMETRGTGRVNSLSDTVVPGLRDFINFVRAVLNINSKANAITKFIFYVQVDLKLVQS